MMRRPSSGPQGRGPGGGLLLSGFATRFPTLCEWMTTETWEDGSARQTTTLFLFCTAGWLKCMMKDRDQGMVAFSTAESLDGILEGLESQLASGMVDWKPDRPPAGRGRK